MLINKRLRTNPGASAHFVKDKTLKVEEAEGIEPSSEKRPSRLYNSSKPYAPPLGCPESHGTVILLLTSSSLRTGARPFSRRGHTLSLESITDKPLSTNLELSSPELHHEQHCAQCAVDRED